MIDCHMVWSIRVRGFPWLWLAVVSWYFRRITSCFAQDSVVGVGMGLSGKSHALGNGRIGGALTAGGRGLNLQLNNEQCAERCCEIRNVACTSTSAEIYIRQARYC